MGREYGGRKTQQLMDSMKASLSSWVAAMDREDIEAAVEFSRAHLAEDVKRHTTVVKMAKVMGRGDLLTWGEKTILEAEED